MKKLFIFLAFASFFILLAGAISASITTDYYLYEKKVLVRHYFDSTSDLELRIPFDFVNLEINSEYTIEKFKNYYLIKVNSTNNLSISYITQSIVDKSGSQFYFVSKNYLDKAQEVKLVLPESAVLSEKGLLFPEPDEITSDGRSIILKWENYDEKQIVVDYEFVKKKNFIYYLVFGFLILVFLAYFLFERRKYKEKLKKIKAAKKKSKPEKKVGEIEEHLMESEKAIINELKKAEKSQLWQKQLQTNTGFSKAKLSRVIRNLEARNLIQKIPYGNTNKIKLKIK